MPVNTGKLVTESENNGPTPLEHLFGCANETRVKVEGVEMTALVDTRSQISTLTEGFCNERGLRILPLRNLVEGVLCLEGMGALQYHIKGYVEVDLTIPDFPHYQEDVVLLVVANHTYWDRV